MTGSPYQRKILLESGTNEVEIMEFSIGQQHFGINVAKVKRLVRWDHNNVTRLDMAPPGVVGSYHFMKHQLLLIDLRQVLEIQAAIVNPERQLILVSEFNNHLYAFIIDAVNRIHRVSWKKLQPIEGMASLQSPYTTASLQLDARVIMILDLEHITSEIAPEQSVHGSHKNFEDVKLNFDRKTVQIVYAEDSAMIRKITVDQLKKSGFENIILKTNGKLAFEYLKEIRQKALTERKGIENYIHLLLSDIEMPQMDGLSLCRAVREELGFKKLPIVMYSSLINDQMANKCKSVGASAWMSKPEIAKIINLIDQYCLQTTEEPLTPQ